MHSDTSQDAWLRLAHAFPADANPIAALRSSVPDLNQLGERLQALINGDPSAFADGNEPDTAQAFSAKLYHALHRQATGARVEQLKCWVAEKAHRHLLTPAHDDYPVALHALCDPPAMLAVVGQREALRLPGVGIVGSRNASRVGLATARQFGGELAKLGLSVVSGLAIGIDGAAHAGAVDSDGVTIAVSATGPDRIYPARHAALARSITARGAIVSEYPLGEGVQRERFPQRNRLVAALSLGVVVIEAARRSGTLSTATHAADLGKPVMPVPGTIANSNNGGSHDLIRDGAALVESTADITTIIADSLEVELERASDRPASVPKTEELTLDPDGQRVWSHLSVDSLTVDALHHQTALSPQRIMAALSRLELRGLVEPLSSGGYARCLR